MSDGATPLVIASQILTILEYICWYLNGYVEFVQLLLEVRADPNRALPQRGASALHIACQNGHLEVARLLLDVGAEVNKTMHDGTAALFLASQQGYLEIVQMLLQQAADANMVNESMGSSLVVACEDGHLDVARTLLEARADQRATDDGTTPLFVAAQNGHLAVVSLMLELGANTEFPIDDGATPLLVASWNGHSEVVRVLLGARADMHVKQDTGATPLHAACTNCHGPVIKLLLEARADVHGYLATARGSGVAEFIYVGFAGGEFAGASLACADANCSQQEDGWYDCPHNPDNSFKDRFEQLGVERREPLCSAGFPTQRPWFTLHSRQSDSTRSLRRMWSGLYVFMDGTLGFTKTAPVASCGNYSCLQGVVAADISLPVVSRECGEAFKKLQRQLRESAYSFPINSNNSAVFVVNHKSSQGGSNSTGWLIGSSGDLGAPFSRAEESSQ
ncbi:Asb3, partial [Symbiodinium sp. KB8]